MIAIAALALLLQAPAAPDAPKVKKVCRKIPVIGSNLPRQECRSAEEWAAIDKVDQINAQDRAQLQRMQAQGGRGGGV